MIKVKMSDEPAIKVTVGAVIYTSTNGKEIEIGSGLKLENNVLSVDTAETAEEDNTKPITSAAVFAEVGNIEVLLSLI